MRWKSENMELMAITAKGIAIKIRNFEIPDIRRVMEIEEQSFLDGDAGLYLELYEEWPEGFMVAEKEDKVIGFVVMVLTPEGEGRVFALAVDSRYRGGGVGRTLLKAAFAVLRKMKIWYVLLEVRVSNVVAQRLYRSMGFAEIGFVPFYYKDGEGAIEMRKVL
ncbi:MAG: ribosomal protein S18-alanine N-acetyltransferase [Candidatus Syntrophoarchaeum sp.]|nr:ribosomal protein S18-alanine N-acetyltransferase [Candidatus Syntrophoarchaeum sp.]